MTPWVTRLIVANIIVFFLEITNPGITRYFDFVPALILYRPWTVITYMFLHGGWSHILFNMIGLFFFGPRVEQRLGGSRFFALYFLSGISGAALSFLLAPNAPIIGASGAIMGVMFAFAYFWPRDQILLWGILPVEARWLVVGTTILSLWSGFGGSRGGVADFAHLGGFAGAWLFLRWAYGGGQRFQKRAAPRVADDSLRNWRKIDPQRAHEVNRDELNRVLDKIGRTGLSSLTPQERAFLASFVPMDDRTPPVS